MSSREKASIPRRSGRDMLMLRGYVYTVPTVMRYRPDAERERASAAPADVVARLEGELASELARYRQVMWSILAVLLMPGLVAIFFWSAMYWLPVRIYWWPFERGNYGLPLLSLYEWFCFLLLAAYFAYTMAVLRVSREGTRRMGVDYRRLAASSPDQQAEVAEIVRSGSFPRVAYTLSRSREFVSYRPLLAEKPRS